MNVLELFAGSRSIGKLCDEKGIITFSTDLYKFENNYPMDILCFDYKIIPFVPDVIWASPPCTSFSVASIGHHWTGGNKAYIPKTDAAILGLKILEKTIEVIQYYKKINPNLIYFIENPRGLMRKMPHLKFFDRYTVTYCQYGDTRMKPTDIWTNSKTWVPRKMCKNGSPCHVSAPRGSKTGTQGLSNSYLRSVIPYDLCLDVVNSFLDPSKNSDLNNKKRASNLFLGSYKKRIKNENKNNDK